MPFSRNQSQSFFLSATLSAASLMVDFASPTFCCSLPLTCWVLPSTCTCSLPMALPLIFALMRRTLCQILRVTSRSVSLSRRSVSLSRLSALRAYPSVWQAMQLGVSDLSCSWRATSPNPKDGRILVHAASAALGYVLQVHCNILAAFGG